METTPNSERIAGLKLEAPLAIGPAASAFSARDATDASLVEVRLLHRLSPELRSRLIRLAFASHARLLPILSIHLDGAGPHFLTVQSNAGSWRDAPPRSADGLRGALTQLASALAFAHRMGLVHGCLEPQHVVRGPQGYWLDMTHADAQLPRGRAPELVSGEPPTSAADIWALAVIVKRALRDPASDPELDHVLRKMMAHVPEERPSADEIPALLKSTLAHEVPAALPHAPPREVGPYTLLEKLGEGGMGAVYRARARGDDHDVAIKLLLPEFVRDRTMLQRFRREARVLSQISSPHVARFIAARRDGLWEYLVMEFVEGRSAHWLLDKRGVFSLPAALAIAADIARALADVHDLHLVHRDVKPSNILIAADSDPAVSPRAKLCDFGIVRPKSEDTPALTRSGTPGTPGYMAPEQVLGQEVFPATDVYALGATLFALLTGKPPFHGDPNAVMLAHVSEAPPALESRLPGADPGLSDLIARALRKDASERPRDGRAFLEEVETLRRGAAITTSSLPQGIGIQGAPTVYEFSWELTSTAEELWPHVSNTERLNRAIGLEDVAWTRGDGDGQGLWGSFKAAGLTLRWKENPFEWVAPTRLGVVREYESGPFEWMRSSVALSDHERGTTLSHKIELLPRGLLGRAAAGIEIGMRLRRALERTYRRIDETCQQQRDQDAPQRDPFEQGSPPSNAQRRRLHGCIERARERGGDAAALEALAEWILHAPPQALGRLRPREFAERYRLDRDAVLNALLLATSEGVLSMMWDILCPTCRIPSELHDTLRALKEHGRCDACDLDFELDLARSVELVFRVESSIRRADVGVYCIGGPAHSPHVLAQVRLPVGQRVCVDVLVHEGAYVVRARGMEQVHALRVVQAAPMRRASISLRQADASEGVRVMGSGRVTLELTNDLEGDVVVRVERSGARTDVVTAAAATSSALFRELFPSQVLSPDELISMSQVTLVCAEVPDAGPRYMANGERAVHRELMALQSEVSAAAASEGGALVKMHNDGVLAVFADPLCATRSALAVLRTLGPGVRISVHAGTAMLATINERLDYFGRTVFVSDELLRGAAAGEVVVSADVQALDPRTTQLLHTMAELQGLTTRGAIATRYRLAAAAS